VVWQARGQLLRACRFGLSLLLAAHGGKLIFDHSVFMGYPLSVIHFTEEPYHEPTKKLRRPIDR